jgi:hypothetical protein
MRTDEACSTVPLADTSLSNFAGLCGQKHCADAEAGMQWSRGNPLRRSPHFLSLASQASGTPPMSGPHVCEIEVQQPEEFAGSDRTCCLCAAKG